MRFFLTVIGVVALALGLAGIAVAAGRPQVRLLVVFEDGVANGAARGVLESHGAVLERELSYTPFTGFVVLLPEEAVPAISQARGVARVEPDYVVQALARPGPAPQPAEVLPWGVDRIDADLAWGTSSGTGVKVAIIDTGISKSHPDLVVKGGVNFVWMRGTVDPTKWDDDNGHGSHVAGIAAAVDNNIGVIGVAPGAYLYAVKVLDRNGSGYLSDVIDGIYWARNNGMQVINMSLGCNCDTVSFKQAVDAASNAGVVVVAAAGNSGTADGSGDTMIYPAKYPSVIAVGATDSTNTNTRAWWSSTGSELDLAAPGVSIYSTWKGTGYNTISGTSMASPHVAGTAALVLASPVLPRFDLNGSGSYSGSEVRAALQATADDLGAVGPDNWYGNGLVDAQEATTGIQS